MIRLAGIWVWDRENQQGPAGEQKMPTEPPNWDPSDERGRRDMNDCRTLIIKGIREAAPVVIILQKPFVECRVKKKPQ